MTTETGTDLAPKGKDAALAVIDSSAFSNLLDTAKFEHMWRVAKMFAASDLVPTQYRGKPENCFIASQMAVRLGVDPFMFMQNTYVVHGRPGMEAKLAIALINTSGLFVDSLDYEIDGGEDPFNDKYRVRAFATRKSTNKTVFGPWIDWTLVRREGWDKKEGSKWKTMAGMMFLYRAATFFGRVHCSERLMGMQTVDEVEDVGETVIVQNLASLPSGRSTFRPEAAAGADDQADPKPNRKQKQVVDEQPNPESDKGEGIDHTDASIVEEQEREAKPAKSTATKVAEKPAAKSIDEQIAGLNKDGTRCFDMLVASCQGRTECTDDEAKSAVVKWLGAQGWEIMDLAMGGKRDLVKDAMKIDGGIPWSKHLP